jgi:hypothetical protein
MIIMKRNARRKLQTWKWFSPMFRPSFELSASRIRMKSFAIKQTNPMDWFCNVKLEEGMNIGLGGNERRTHQGLNEKKKNLPGFGPLANYADRAAAACWRSSANFFQ